MLSKKKAAAKPNAAVRAKSAPARSKESAAPAKSGTSPAAKKKTTASKVVKSSPTPVKRKPVPKSKAPTPTEDVPIAVQPVGSVSAARARRKSAPGASAKPDKHFVSVVVPTIGRPSLEPSKAALERQTRPADEIVIVVDKNRRGVSWALNEGIRQAKGDLVAFSPDDGEPDENWLKRLVEAIDRHDADCAGGYYLESDPLLNEIRQLHPMPEEEQIDTTGLIGNGGTIMFKRSRLDECIEKDGHVYNESFPLAEDWELIWRMRRRGLKVVFVPVKTVHLRRVTPLSYVRHQFNRGIGIALLYKLQRKAGPGVAVQRSLIWGQPGTAGGAKWFTAFLQKAIGPFNRSQFSSWGYFWTHWLAEKFQGAGFVWGLIAY